MIRCGRVLRRAAVVVGVFAVCVVAVSGAVAKEPAGRFAVFKECPRFTSGVNYCFYTETLGGEVAIGGRTLPLERPLVLQGGIARNAQTEVETFVGALDGETLSRAPQKVPGGLFGRPLYATLELAQPPSAIEISSSDLINEEGTGVALPVRIRLENPLLGGECYLGSRGSPIMLHLTTGTTSPSPPNEPISGGLGNEMTIEEGGLTLTEIPGDVIVDNTFSIPAASGCGGPGEASLIDSVIDGDLGLPSADGYNTVVEDNTLWRTLAAHVIASE